MKTFIIHIVLLSMLCLSTASAQKYHILQTITGAGGASHATSSWYAMDNTVGQSSTGQTASSGFSMGSGFWEESDALQKFYEGTYAVMEGWNLISMPKEAADYHKSVLYPSAAGTAFAYNGSYVPSDVLPHGTGYWLKYAGDQFITLPGVLLTNDTIHVRKGWNMIGSIGSAVSTGSIVEIPGGIVTSSYFSYGGGYSVAGSVDPGKGYWVKTNSDGMLVLNAPQMASPSAAAVASSPNSSDGMNTLTIETNGEKSYHQQLLFGAATVSGKNTEKYDMPPRAPESKLDVRFATNRYGERFTGETKELPITIQSNGVPVTLSLTVKDRAGTRYILVERKKDKVIEEHTLEEGKSVTLTPIEEESFALRAEQVPLKYTLEQNYPNPFNPTTTIRYALPAGGHVTLKIYDILGQEVTTLIDGEQGAGYQSVLWNASSTASGVYFYRVTASDQSGKTSFSDVRKMMLVK